MQARSNIALLLLACCTARLSALAAPVAARRVLVTGAGGETGSRVLRLLEAKRDNFSGVGLVRTPESRASLPESSDVVVASITDPDAMTACMAGFDCLIICTSAKPAPSGELTAEGRPVFGFPNGQPQEVDWLGQKNQIDAAKAAGLKHVVICGSMGGTNPDNMCVWLRDLFIHRTRAHWRATRGARTIIRSGGASHCARGRVGSGLCRLNGIGKAADGTGGNILLWKRKAEDYLIKSGLTYTVVHPGGLVNEAGGARELVPGVDDAQAGTENRNIPRDDVAAVLVASLEHESYACRSFDVRSKPEGEGTPTVDYGALLDGLEGANCDYSLGEIPQ